jgi:serine/threonine protein kinase
MPTMTSPYHAPALEPGTSADATRLLSTAGARKDPDAVPASFGLRLGPYQLVEPIGAGSQAVVWRAVQREPVARELAIKLLYSPRDQDRRRLARFRREAARGMRLTGRGVLPVLDFGETDEVAYMVMPLVDGTSLHEVIARRRGRGEESPAVQHWLAELPDAAYTRAIVRSLARVARALARVHAARIAHRDVKPANILLDRRRPDRIFLADFGLSRDLDVATPEQLSDGAGTLLYMAPERLLIQRADEVRCDIYALGVTLYEAATLARPFRLRASVSRVALAALVATRGPRRPRSVRPGIPRELEEIILRAMALDPEARHPTAAALADDLDQFLARREFRTRATSLPRPRAGWRRLLARMTG